MDDRMVLLLNTDSTTIGDELDYQPWINREFRIADQDDGVCIHTETYMSDNIYDDGQVGGGSSSSFNGWWVGKDVVKYLQRIKVQ